MKNSYFRTRADELDQFPNWFYPTYIHLIAAPLSVILIGIKILVKYGGDIDREIFDGFFFCSPAIIV